MFISRMKMGKGNGMIQIRGKTVLMGQIEGIDKITCSSRLMRILMMSGMKRVKNR